MKHWTITTLTVLACAVAVLPAAAQTVEKNGVRLRYRGVHFGDHPITTYERIATIRSGPENWQLDMTEVHDGDKKVRPRANWSVELDRKTGRMVRERFEVADGSYGFDFSLGANARLNGSVVKGPAKIPVNVKLSAAADSGGFGLDLFVASLPLADNFTRDILVVDSEDAENPKTRPFRISVERRQPYRLDGTDIETFRVIVDPLDGKTGGKGTLLARITAPHWVMRADYVSHAETTKDWPKSTGTDTLIAIEPL